MDSMVESCYKMLTLEEYYVKLSPRLKGYASAHLNYDETSADDVIQDVFEKQMRLQLADNPNARWNFKSENQAWAYFFTCVNNACSDYFRKEEKHRNYTSLHEHDMEPASPINFESDLFSEIGHQELLHLAKQHLKGRQLEVFLLIHENELSLKEVAERLNIKVNSVYTASHYANLKLEDKLGKTKRRKEP